MNRICYFQCVEGLTLREEHKLRVLRTLFGPKRDEVVGGWIRVLNEELCNFYTSSNTTRVMKSRRMRWAGHEACMGEMRNADRILVGKA
jgi:hypothetical protein